MLDSNIAIKVEELSKRYYIGKEKDGSLRGTLSSLFQSSNQSKEEFWALKDISFEVQKGDVVGIIGKNGAGKSTLLKILSQITKPTEGKISINGRIASLLEVGTGFHPELSGRENIYLNGTILGMTRKEVKAKFDEIVAFSGIEKFIDTPVKHYSSGMYVRLAFSVAAHLEPEILIIDEVLAVGDAEFQKKCLGKMKDVAGNGRTVLFVSHNIAAVNDLCNRCILLNKSKFIMEGDTSNVLTEYNSLVGIENNNYENGTKFIKNVTFTNKKEPRFMYNESISLQVELLENKWGGQAFIGVAMLDKWKRKIFTTQVKINKNKQVYTMTIPKSLFLQGEYSFDVALFVPNSIVHEYLTDICLFEIIDFESELSYYDGADIGVIHLNGLWD